MLNRTSLESLVAKLIIISLLSSALSALCAAAGPKHSSGIVCQPMWTPTFGGGFGVDNFVLAQAVFDDGTGPALYVGGRFTHVGAVPANHIVKWDGQSWSSVGGGIQAVLASEVDTMVVFDDGAGPALYVGGFFSIAGGAAANNIAKWDGLSWTPLGVGTNDQVDALAVFDDGTGPALYASGGFRDAGGVLVNNVARWDGQSWSSLGAGTDKNVFALQVFDDGSGPALYAGGKFSSAGTIAANNIAKWNGQSWSSLGVGTDKAAHVLAVFDDGAGAALYIGGEFNTAGGISASNIAKWNGQSWSTLGSGIQGLQGFQGVHGLGIFDDGTGPALYVGGAFTSAGVAANNIARWDGQIWSPLGSGTDATVVDLTVFDDGAGPVLYVGGGFTIAGGAIANRVARWQGCPVVGPPSADLNGDGAVNASDLATLLAQWGTAGSADLNSDGVVNAADLATLLANWGP